VWRGAAFLRKAAKRLRDLSSPLVPNKEWSKSSASFSVARVRWLTWDSNDREIDSAEVGPAEHSRHRYARRCHKRSGGCFGAMKLAFLPLERKGRASECRYCERCWAIGRSCFPGSLTGSVRDPEAPHPSGWQRICGRRSLGWSCHYIGSPTVTPWKDAVGSALQAKGSSATMNL
jgi:hypothetical protein